MINIYYFIYGLTGLSMEFVSDERQGYSWKKSASQPVEGYIRERRYSVLFWATGSEEPLVWIYTFYSLKVLIKRQRKRKIKIIQPKHSQMAEWFVSSTMGFVNHKVSNSKINHHITRHQNPNFTLVYKNTTVGSSIWVNNIADKV